MMRPSSASALASRVGLLLVCSVRMSPEACTTPSFREPARRSKSYLEAGCVNRHVGVHVPHVDGGTMQDGQGGARLGHARACGESRS